MATINGRITIIGRSSVSLVARTVLVVRRSAGGLGRQFELNGPGIYSQGGPAVAVVAAVGLLRWVSGHIYTCFKKSI